LQHPSKKQKKKRRSRLLPAAAVLLLVLAAALLYLFPQIQKRHPGKSTPIEIIQPDFRTLEIRDARELDTVTVFPSGSDSYTLQMHNGALHLRLMDELLPVSDVYADELLEVFTHIVAQETVTDDISEVQEHLPDMGLAPPKARAVIGYQDGSQAAIEVGSAVPGTTYAYYRWSGDAGVYMCDVGVSEALALTRNHLLPVSQPDVVSSLIAELSLSNVHGSSRFRFGQMGSGALTEPFAYPLSHEASDRLLSALQNFRLGTRQAVVTEENRAFYGFDQPLCTIEFHQRAGYANQIDASGALISAETPAQSVRYVIGRAEGDYFYTCEYAGSCYFVSRFLTDTLVNVNPETLITRNPADLNGTAIASILLEAPQGAVTVDVLRAERVLSNNQLELDENGQIAYDIRLLLNGEEKAPALLDELTDRLNTLTAEGSVPADYSPSAGEEPRWSLKIETISGDTRVIDAYRMDAFSDALMVDGVIRHYVHSDAIDVLMADLL